MKFNAITRDWKGSYGKPDFDKVKGMILHGGEDEIDTGGDCFAMIFVDGETDKTPQELWNMLEQDESDPNEMELT